MPTKSKKPSVEIKPEFELPAQGSEPPRKKKKKNAPDKPQPEWMFPPDEENPVINPKPKSEAHISKDEKERDQAIRFLQYTSVTAPMKAPPPDLLLSLVGAFLSSYGFHHTSRLYTTQLQSRKKLDAWKIELGAKLPKGFPDLVKIFKEWYKGYQEKLRVEETSSSDSDDSDDANAVKKSKKAKKAKKEVKAEAKASEAAAAKVIAKDITSSSGSGSSDEDVEMKDAIPAQKPTKKSSELSKIKSSSISVSTSHSSSDSDADDEKENAGAQLVLPTASPKPTVNGLVNSLKRKASPDISSSSESESDSDTSSSAGLQAVSGKKDASSSIFNVISQPQNSVPISKPSAESSSSSDTSSSDSGSAAKPAKPAKPAAATTAIAKAESGPSSDSSSSDSEFDNGSPKSTLTTTTTTKAEASSSSSSSESISSDGESSEVDFSKPPKPTVTKTTKVVTAKPTQVSSDSSVTLQASSAQKPSAANTSLSSTSSSDSLTSADQQAVTTVTTTTTSTKRKRSSSPTPKASKFTKKQNTPFQRVPQDTPVDPKMASNAYRSYDYADRAHQDLSVTKGKGFTKEKNKKKRGSYRGGAIDVSGGKGVKFVD